MEPEEDKDNLNSLRQINNNSLIQIQHEEGDEANVSLTASENKSQEKVLHINAAEQEEESKRHSPEHGQETGESHGHGHSHGGHGHGHRHGRGHGKKGKPKKNYFVIFYTIFTCLSCAYLQTQQLNPYIGSHHSKLMTYLCYIDVFLCLWSYYQTMTISSQVKKIKLHEHHPYPLMPMKDCGACNFAKVARVSHCSQCGVCIYKLDHHCMWTQTCIGYRNQKPFYLFCLYMSIGVCQFWWSTSKVVHELNMKCHFFGTFEPGVYLLWGITCFSASVVGLMIIMLAIGHTVMIMTNFTTLDSIKTKGVCPMPFCEFRKKRLQTDNINSWDRGQVQNFKEFFGTNILTWWMPFGRQIENDFLFEKQNPFVSSKSEPPSKDRCSPEVWAKRLAGKKIKVNDEIIQFDQI